MMKERRTFRPSRGCRQTPKVELKELREDEDAILNSYGWVDPAKDIVRIPIDQAIDMVAQKDCLRNQARRARITTVTG